MHDIKSIRDNPGAFDAALKRRGLEPQAFRLLAIDEKRRIAIRALEEAQTRRNSLSAQIGVGRKAGQDTTPWEGHVTALKSTFPALETASKAADEELRGALSSIPNLPAPDVPDGFSEADNVQRHVFGTPRTYAFAPKPHDELLSQLMDFEAAARMSGSRFVVLRAGLARLERALGQFMLDLHTNEHGYTEISPPLLVRDAAMYGTAQLPKFAEDQFRAGDEHWLIPTAEVPLTNLVRESTVTREELPLRFTALTACFRKEAGSAGRDTRGMIRQHQFNKVELVSVVSPERSRDEHERMLACAEEVLRRLDLHYRVVTLCAGDMGFAAQKTYDIEVWIPGQKAFREISSVSVCGDFQARRMDARLKGGGFVHTLNGSGVAVGRALIAVMENYQRSDSGVDVPEVLQPYMGGVRVVSS